jgi:hypothetical protein
MIGALFWPSETPESFDEDAERALRPNDLEEMPSTLRH